MASSFRLLRAFVNLLRLRGSVNRRQYWAGWVLLLSWYVLAPLSAGIFWKLDSDEAFGAFLGTVAVFLWVCSGLMAARCRDAGKTTLWALTPLVMVLTIVTVFLTSVEHYPGFPIPMIFLPIAGAGLVAMWLGFVQNADSQLTW